MSNRPKIQAEHKPAVLAKIRSGLTYPEIATWYLEEHGIVLSVQNVYDFAKRNNVDSQKAAPVALDQAGVPVRRRNDPEARRWKNHARICAGLKINEDELDRYRNWRAELDRDNTVSAWDPEGEYDPDGKLTATKGWLRLPRRPGETGPIRIL
jgi:hypothetical protein